MSQLILTLRFMNIKGLPPLQGLHWLVFWDHTMGCTHRFGMTPFPLDLLNVNNLRLLL